MTMGLQEQFGKIGEAGPRAATFVSEVWSELQKVHYPTRKETYAATLVVLVVTVVVAAYLGLVDFALSYLVQAILS